MRFGPGFRRNRTQVSRRFQKDLRSPLTSDIIPAKRPDYRIALIEHSSPGRSVPRCDAANWNSDAITWVSISPVSADF